MVSFELALSAWVALAPLVAAAVPLSSQHLEVSSVRRSLQGTNDYEIEAAIACYYSQAAGAAGTCNDLGGTVYTLFSGAEPDPGTLVVAFGHDPVVSGGGSLVTYYDSKCTTALATDATSILPTTPNPGTDMDAIFGTAVSTLDQFTRLDFSLQTLATLPLGSVVTVTGNGDVYDVDFCIRLSLYDADGVERGFREADLRIVFDIDDDTSVSLLETDNNDPDSSDLDFGDFTVEASICTDSPAGVPTTSGSSPVATPLEQGQTVAICLVPQLNGFNTLDIKVTDIEDFVFFIDSDGTLGLGQFELQQQAFVDGVIQSGTALTENNDAACGSGLPDGSDIFGCRFLTTLNSAFYDNPPASSTAAGTGDNLVTASGTVEIEYLGRRRKLQLSEGATTTKNTSTQISTVVTRRGSADDVPGFCDFSDSGFWRWLSFITRPLCNFIVRFIFGPLFGVQA